MTIRRNRLRNRTHESATLARARYANATKTKRTYGATKTKTKKSMSYSILYRTMFVKVDNDRFIPLYECGDNNVWESGRNRRARDWMHYYPCYLRKDSKSLPFFTENELMGLVSDDVKESVYCGTKVSGTSCTDEKDQINYWKRAIRKAKTFEELEAADITLEVKDCNYYDKEAPHFSQKVHNVEELTLAWTMCLAECGTAQVKPYYVSDYTYSRLYPKQPKVKREHSQGYVVTINGDYISKASPRRFWHCWNIETAHVYTTRASAEKLQQRILRNHHTSEIVPVRKREGRWEKAA